MEQQPYNQKESAAVATSSANGKNIFNIMMGVFFGPVEAFQSNKNRPRIIVPLIALLVLLVIAVIPQTPYQAKQQVDLLSKSTTIPPQVLEQIEQRAADASPVQGVITACIIVVILGVVGALVAWFIGSFIMGGEATFKQMWSTGILGGLITMFGAIIRMLMVLAKGDMSATIGLAALFPNKDFTSIFYSLLFYFDLFAIWAIIVTGIGYGIVLGISRGRGIVTALIWYVLFSIIMIGLSSFGLTMAGVEITFF